MAAAPLPRTARQRPCPLDCVSSAGSAGTWGRCETGPAACDLQAKAGTRPRGPLSPRRSSVSLPQTPGSPQPGPARSHPPASLGDSQRGQHCPAIPRSLLLLLLLSRAQGRRPGASSCSGEQSAVPGRLEVTHRHGVQRGARGTRCSPGGPGGAARGAQRPIRSPAGGAALRRPGKGAGVVEVAMEVAEWAPWRQGGEGGGHTQHP